MYGFYFFLGFFQSVFFVHFAQYTLDLDTFWYCFYVQGTMY